MTEDMIVAMFATETDAEAAIRDLEAASIPGIRIVRHAKLDTVPGYSVSSVDQTDTGGFWSRLFSGEPEGRASDGEEEGFGAIITVHSFELDADAIIDILERHELIDVDRHVTSPGPAAGAESDTVAENTADRL